MQAALNRNIDPLEVFKEFQRMQPQELNNYIMMFLNLDRVGTSVLGVANAPSVSQYVSRSIIPWKSTPKERIK